MRDELEQSFWDHLEDLRKTLLLVGLVVLCGTILSFCFRDRLFELLSSPLYQIQSQSSLSLPVGLKADFQEVVQLRNLSTEHQKVPPGIGGLDDLYLAPGESLQVMISKTPSGLVVLGPAEGLVNAFKLSFYCGLLATFPLWGFMIFRFVQPALKPKERNLLIPFGLMSMIMLCVGFSVAYWVTIPFANSFFYHFNQEIGVNLWSLSQYMDYSVLLLLANGLAFEGFVILIFLVKAGFVGAGALRSKRRHAAVTSFILGAVLTPPDVLTQLCLALPLMVLYELGILYAGFKERRKAATLETLGSRC